MSDIQNGVSKKSKMFFFSNNVNSDLYFYPISTGHFYCNSNYIVKRERFDSLLILYVISGTFSFILDNNEYTAKSGKTVIINCFEPHTYFTSNSFEAYWIHINGGNIRSFYDEIVSRYGNIIANASLENDVKSIYSIAESKVHLTESEMSLKLYSMLISLINSTRDNDKNNIINKALEYMMANYHKQISVENIARQVNISSSQFSRKFKAQLGTSPYDYLLNIRLTKAKELLKNTSLSISEIAYQTGFASDSNFIYFFKRQENISPLKFRNMLY